MAKTVFAVWKEEVQVSEVELRNPGLHLDLISKAYLKGPEWSQREVNDFSVIGGSCGKPAPGKREGMRDGGKRLDPQSQRHA